MQADIKDKQSTSYELSPGIYSSDGNIIEATLSHPDKNGHMIPSRTIVVSNFLSRMYSE